MAAHQHDGTAVPGLAAPERPTKDETQAGGTALGSKDQVTTDSADCAEPATERKRVATLTATFALHGAQLMPAVSGGFSLHCGGWWRELPDLQAVESMARRMGVCHE